jgi:two-component system, NtrC family, nitrogen regulation response regulator NtrX
MEKVNNILVIDDDPDQCQTLKDILEENGYQVDTASNSVKALGAVKNKQYDLVIIDLVLKEEKNGVDVFKEMKNIRPEIKALLFTGYGPQEEIGLIFEAAKAGMFDEILRKPIWPEELLKAVAKHTRENRRTSKE